MKHTHTHTYRTKLQHHVLLAAINNHLSKECTFILTTVAPELMEYPKNQLTIEGSNVTFSCIAGGSFAQDLMDHKWHRYKCDC